MKYFFSIIFCLVFLSSCERESGVQSVSTEQQVLNLLKEWTTAITTQDSATLHQLASHDYIFTGHDGATMNKQQNIAAMTDPLFKITEFETSDVKIETTGDTAVVSGKAVLQLRVGDDTDPSNSETEFAQKWVRTNGIWQIVSELSTQAH